MSCICFRKAMATKLMVSRANTEFIQQKSTQQYQARIIKAIKHKLDISRAQWENSLQEKTLMSTDVNLQNGEMWTDKSFQKADESKVPFRTQSVRVVSSSLIDYSSMNCKLILELDIRQFSPDDEITFRTDKQGLLVCSKQTNPKNKIMEKIKIIPVHGLIESERIKVRPSSYGTILLELQVIKN